MNDTANNLHVVLKQISKFDGNKADDFLEWSSKLRASLSIYNRAIFNIMQRQERPSVTDDGEATSRAAGMPPTRIYSAYCSFRRAAQPYSSYGDSRA